MSNFFQKAFQKLSQSAVSIGVSGLIAWGGVKGFGLNGSINIPKLGAQSYAIALPMVVMASSAIAEISFDFILPLVQKNLTFLTWSEMTLSPLITVGASLLLLRVADKTEFQAQWKHISLISGASRLGGIYAEQMWKTSPFQLGMAKRR